MKTLKIFFLAVDLITSVPYEGSAGELKKIIENVGFSDAFAHCTCSDCLPIRFALRKSAGELIEDIKEDSSSDKSATTHVYPTTL